MSYIPNQVLLYHVHLIPINLYMVVSPGQQVTPSNALLYQNNLWIYLPLLEANTSYSVLIVIFVDCLSTVRMIPQKSVALVMFLACLETCISLTMMNTVNSLI